MGKLLIKRLFYGFIGFILIIIMYSTVLNVQLDVTVKEQIRGMVNGVLMSDEVVGKSASEIAEYREQLQDSLEKSFDLDKPAYVRILNRSYKAILLDFGQSRFLRTTKRSSSVKDLILESLPATLILFGITTLLSMGLAIFLGVTKAKYANSPFDRITTILTMVFSGTPAWWMASLLVLILVFRLELFPFGALSSTPPPEGAIAAFFDRASFMIVPILAVLMVRVWSSAYMIKTLLMEPLQQDFVMAARGRGIPENKIFYGHALRSVSPAVVTMSLLAIVSSIGGDILVERVLARPGIGTLLWNAVSSNDLPVMMGVLTIITVLYCTVLALLDFIYLALDPRIKY